MVIIFMMLNARSMGEERSDESSPRSGHPCLRLLGI